MYIYSRPYSQYEEDTHEEPGQEAGGVDGPSDYVLLARVAPQLDRSLREADRSSGHHLKKQCYYQVL